MYLEERLEKMCQENAKAREKLAQWHVIRQESIEKLGTVCTHFPHFSKHDHSHSQTIAEQIGKLLGRERINQLSCSDILMMLASVYLHDIGMALEYEEIYEKFTSEEFHKYLLNLAGDQNSELQNVAKRLCAFSGGRIDYESSIDVYNDVVQVIEDTYRSEHSKRSAVFVCNHEEIRRCFGIRCQKHLANICAAHQRPICEIMNLPSKDNGLFDDYIHPRFLAAMLCLGDLLDLDTDRFDETVLRANSPMPHLSKIHLKKHESVERFLVDEEGIRIQSNADCIDVYNVVRQWVDWIQEACDFIALHWSELAPNDFGNAPRLAQQDLLLNGSKRWIALADLHYEISPRRMFELLAGGKFYQNKLVCIREILQNAIDATIFRLFDEKTLQGTPQEILRQLRSLDWKTYKITGRIEKKDETHIEVCVRDCGIGVSEDDILKIARVSNIKSDHRQDLINTMPSWIRPAGAFGIGLQSIFLLADEFVMCTKTIDEPPKKITFQKAGGGNGYIIVEDYNERFTQGTEVRFIMDATKMTVDELGCPNYYYKRKLLSRWLLRRVRSQYSNQIHLGSPIRENRKKKWADVPVEIDAENMDTEKNNTLIQLEPFFSVELKEIDVENGYLRTNFFFQDLNCYLSCKIGLMQKSTGNEDVHLYEKIPDGIFRYSNAIFYRHEFVTEGEIGTSFLTNMPIFPYIAWRIDLMGEDADAVLHLNRNSIKESYIYIFIETLLAAIEASMKCAIDFLIKHSKEQDILSGIGDTILLMYQFARQYKYHANDLLSAYQDSLYTIRIGNYTLWASKESKVFSFSELNTQSIYFAVETVESSILPEHVKKQAMQQTLDQNYLCLLRLKGDERAHILNHQAEKIFIAQVGDEFVEVVQAKPFVYLDPMDRAPAMDDIVFLFYIIRMFTLRLRGLPVIQGYELLAAPVTSESFSLGFYMSNQEYIIEMPFDECAEEICAELEKAYYVADANGKYYQRIMESEQYQGNLEYIHSYHDVKIETIERSYRAFIQKVLSLLADAKYVDFNRHILGTFPDERHGLSPYNRRDVLEMNAYLATVLR